MPPKYAVQCVSVWHKSRLKSRGFLQKYGIRTPKMWHTNPPFMPYEPFLLGVEVVLHLLKYSCPRVRNPKSPCLRFCQASTSKVQQAIGRLMFIQCWYWEELRSLYEGAKPQPSAGQKICTLRSRDFIQCWGWCLEEGSWGIPQSNLSGDTFSIEAPQNLLRTKRIF